MGKIPNQFIPTIKQLAAALKSHQYAIRGTSSLILQNIDMNVDDIDIVCDKQTALGCNQLSLLQLIKPVTYQESKQYKSYFGQFKLNQILVEIYGEWQIKDKKGRWSTPFTASQAEINLIDLEGQPVKVTTPDTELKMFALSGRWTAYHKIRRQVTTQSTIQPSLF